VVGEVPVFLERWVLDVQILLLVNIMFVLLRTSFQYIWNGSQGCLCLRGGGSALSRISGVLVLPHLPGPVFAHIDYSYGVMVFGI